MHLVCLQEVCARVWAYLGSYRLLQEVIIGGILLFYPVLSCSINLGCLVTPCKCCSKCQPCLGECYLLCGGPCTCLGLICLTFGGCFSLFWPILTCSINPMSVVVPIGYCGKWDPCLWKCFQLSGWFCGCSGPSCFAFLTIPDLFRPTQKNLWAW